LRVKYCCPLAYYCPEREQVTCYRHGGTEPCCTDEQAHECLEDMYGAGDEMVLGDGFMCARCGNYAMTGVEHEPPSESGYPVKGTPATADDRLVFVVDDVNDVVGRDDLLLVGRVLAGVVTRDAILRTYQEAPVRVLAVEPSGDQVTLLVTTDVPLTPGHYLTV
jgi:hypothetical protein